MSDRTQENRVIQFGAFELDLAAGELLKGGSKVRLQEQPYQVLVALLERPGEVVTREELQERVWGGETFVDFDHSLSTAVNKIRQALGDSASHPRFVETVPRRGYRFLAEVAQAVPRAKKPARGTTRLAFFWAAGCLAAVAAAAFLMGRVGTEPSPPPAAYTPVPITSFPGFEYHAAISPDGKRVAYSRSTEPPGFNIYVQTIGADDDPIQLTDGSEHDFSLTWSPDGNHLAFVRFTPEGSEIIRIPSIGGPETILGELSISVEFLDFSLVFRYLDWSPDGKFLAVAQPGEAGSPALYQLEIATGEQTPFPQPEIQFPRDPAYAPDGRTLAYAGFQVLSSADIWLQDLAENGGPLGAPRRLTEQNSFINGLDWTADGGEIVYASNFEKSQRLWRADVEGGRQPSVQVGGELGRSPSIAAESNRLVYGRRPYDSDIWSVPGPLTDKERRAAPLRIVSSTREDASVDFSPDGKRIVFVSSRTGNQELWTSAADGSDLNRVTSLNGPFAGSPSWSPNRQFIAFDGNPGNSAQDLYLVRSDGGPVQRLTTADAHDIRPAWSRDGEWIYFCSRRTGKWRIWKLPAAGGEPIQVADEDGFRVYESADGSLYYQSNIKGDGDIWRLPAGGGAREHVLAGIETMEWTAFDGGICYVKSPDDSPVGLWFYDFSTRQSSRFGELPEGAIVYGSPGMSVSPDGKQIVLSLLDSQPESDVMMLDGFR